MLIKRGNIIFIGAIGTCIFGTFLYQKIFSEYTAANARFYTGAIKKTINENDLGKFKMFVNEGKNYVNFNEVFDYSINQEKAEFSAFVFENTDFKKILNDTSGPFVQKLKTNNAVIVEMCKKLEFQHKKHFLELIANTEMKKQLSSLNNCL